MDGKYIEVTQNPNETIIEYIKRLDTMQKTVTDETIYYGLYESIEGESYFSGKNLPLIEENTEYKFFPTMSGDVTKIMEKMKNILSERINNGEDIHYYTLFGNIGFVSSEEILFSDDMNELFDDKFELQRTLSKEHNKVQEIETNEPSEKEIENLNEKYIKVPKKPKENVIDYIKRLSELQQKAPKNTIYFGHYENEEGETYFNGANLPPVDFDKEYMYISPLSGTVTKNMERLKEMTERLPDTYLYTLYDGNAGFVCGEQLTSCENEKDIDNLFEKLYAEQQKLRRIDISHSYNKYDDSRDEI